jgi:transposase-like protein
VGQGLSLSHQVIKMTTQFKNLTQLLDFFKDEEVCKKYYEQQRWGGNIACPHCGNAGKIYRTNRGFKCGEKLCAKKFSVISGTIFENSKIGLRTWFAAMYLISTSKKGVSSLQLAEQLGITQKTAWFVNHRIREMLTDNSSDQLKDVVQIDETLVGGLNKNRHADKKHKNAQGGAGKAVVIGALGLDGKLKAKVIPNTEITTILPVMNEWVEKGSIMVTDEARQYLKSLDVNFFHVSVNHSEGQYVNGAFTTNGVENFWSTFKRGIIGIYHFVSPQHLHRYVTEFEYRYNNRQDTGVDKFLTAIFGADAKRLKYDTLIGKEEKGAA